MKYLAMVNKTLQSHVSYQPPEQTTKMVEVSDKFFYIYSCELDVNIQIKM